ncbi:MAG: hypothetical protein Fur005_44940 [Roseiflexaceae bacterium]
MNGFGKWVLPLVIITLALFTRWYGLEAQSLWADEGGTLALAARPLDQILRQTLADVHPPLYYWVLHLWMGIFGQTAAAARGLSAICGGLAAGLIAILGRRWFGHWAGWLAGISAAFSPLAIYYGQEARMYTLAELLAVGLFLLLDGLINTTPTTSQRRQRSATGWLIGYSLVAAALLMTHYATAGIVAAAGLAGLLALRHAPARAALFCLLHLPLAALYLAALQFSSTSLLAWTTAKAATPPWFVLQDAIVSMSVGLFSPAGWGWWSIILALLALFGMFCPRQVGEPRGAGGMASLWLIVPLAALILLSLNQPYYKPRFLMPALPAFLLLVGRGAALLATYGIGQIDHGRPIGQRWLWALAVGGLLCGGSVPPLLRMANDPATWRDDYRAAAAQIASTIGPDDLLILNGQSQIDTLNYYLKGDQPRILLPRVRPLDPMATVNELATLTSQHRRVYGLFYVLEESDPQGVMVNWLDRNSFASGARWYGGILLRTWETGDLSGQYRPLEQAIGPFVAQQIAIAGENASIDEAIRIQIAWQAERPGSGFNLFVHLIDQNGNLAGQYDGPLAYDPATSWLSRGAILIPAGTPPDQYRLRMGIYDPADGTRQTTPSGQDSIEIGTITIQPSP